MRFIYEICFSFYKSVISLAMHLNYVCLLPGIKLELEQTTSTLQRGVATKDFIRIFVTSHSLCQAGAVCVRG